MNDYSHVTISEGDPSELADMKLAYLTAARQRDALLDALKQIDAKLRAAGWSAVFSPREIARAAIKAAS